MIKREGECPIVLCTAVACTGARSMSFTICGVIVGSRILVARNARATQLEVV